MTFEFESRAAWITEAASELGVSELPSKISKAKATELHQPVESNTIGLFSTSSAKNFLTSAKQLVRQTRDKTPSTRASHIRGHEAASGYLPLATATATAIVSNARSERVQSKWGPDR